MFHRLKALSILAFQSIPPLNQKSPSCLSVSMKSYKKYLGLLFAANHLQLILFSHVIALFPS